MKEMIKIFNTDAALEENHFTTSDLKTKAEAATIYMLNDNFYSADVLFSELESKPSNEVEYQLMIALFVLKMESFRALSLQSWEHMGLVIRSRSLWYLYPFLFIIDLFIEHPLELLLAKTKYKTWSYFRRAPEYKNKLNDSIYKQLLTR